MTGGNDNNASITATFFRLLPAAAEAAQRTVYGAMPPYTRTQVLTSVP